MIKFVVDLRGMKRFKKNPADTDLSSNDIMTDVKAMTNAKDVFRKMTNTTQYSQQFGARPSELKDHRVLNTKSFSKLAISQVLKPNIVAMLSRWLTINDQEKFTERIFGTVREMYTVIKSLLAEVPTSQDHHSDHIELEATPPRFDKILLAQAERRRDNSKGDSTLSADIRRRRTKSYFEAVDFKVGSRHRDNDPFRLDRKCLYLGPPMIDTKAFK